MWFSIKISTSNKGHSLEIMEKHSLLREPRQAGLRIREAFGQEGLLGPWRGRFNHAQAPGLGKMTGGAAAPVTFSLQTQAQPQRVRRKILFILVLKKNF